MPGIYPNTEEQLVQLASAGRLEEAEQIVRRQAELVDARIRDSYIEMQMGGLRQHHQLIQRLRSEG